MYKVQLGTKGFVKPISLNWRKFAGKPRQFKNFAAEYISRGDSPRTLPSQRAWFFAIMIRSSSLKPNLIITALRIHLFQDNLHLNASVHLILNYFVNTGLIIFLLSPLCFLTKGQYLHSNELYWGTFSSFSCKIKKKHKYLEYLRFFQCFVIFHVFCCTGMLEVELLNVSNYTQTAHLFM